MRAPLPCLCARVRSFRRFIGRAYEVDVTYQMENRRTMAGRTGMNALQMAKSTEVKRVGGRRDSTLMSVAQASRAQLANYLAANPQGVGHGEQQSKGGGGGGDAAE